MKLQQAGKRHQFSIFLPKGVVDALGWKKSDNITVKVAGKNRLELVKE